MALAAMHCNVGPLASSLATPLTLWLFGPRWLLAGAPATALLL